MSLRLAAKEAIKSDYAQKLGAVVLYKGRVVSKGHNKLKTHPRLHKQYGHYSTHAECAALLRAAEGDTLIVVRVMKNGSYSCSRPCEKCLQFIRDYGIRKIIYTDWDGTVIEWRLT